MGDDPIRRFTLLVLFQAQHDRATELAIAPAASGVSPIRYKVGRTWYDMAPPPAHLLPVLIAELGRLAGFSEKPFPREGIIDVPYSGTRLRWVVRMPSSESGCSLVPMEQ